MPELPEVEVTRRGLAGALVGARIEAVALGKPLRWPLGCDPGILTGQQIVGLRRRGKYLLADTSEGMLLLHLGMSGSLRFDTLHRRPRLRAQLSLHLPPGKGGEDVRQPLGRGMGAMGRGKCVVHIEIA